MKASLQKGILCVHLSEGVAVLDTGSPVSLGDGNTFNLDGIFVKTNKTMLSYSWDLIKNSIPFDAAALFGTDQLTGGSLCIDIHGESVTFDDPLQSGESMEMIAGVPVISVRINDINGRFFFDTGASICYVTDEKIVNTTKQIGNFDDFHPILGKFTTNLFSSKLNFGDKSMNVEVGILPKDFCLMLDQFGIDGIIGTNSIKNNPIRLDFTNNLYQFPEKRNTLPHDTWADSYDLIFDESFGSLLRDITNQTLEIVSTLSEPGELILDVGSGTGRMTRPLLESNYAVTALDPSSGMINKLRNNIQENNNLQFLNCAAHKLDQTDKYNGAICLFTVTSYWIDENALRDSLIAIYQALLPGGWFIVDRTLRSSFSNTIFENDKVKRSAIVEHLGDDIFQFSEKSIIKSKNKKIKLVDDSFKIKFWEEDIFLDNLLSIGFNLEKDLSKSFHGSGASFYLLRK